MTTTCAHLGCGGIIGSDGACEDCGRPAQTGFLISQVSTENAGEALGMASSGEAMSFPSSRIGTASHAPTTAASDKNPNQTSRYAATKATKTAKASSRRVSGRDSASQGNAARRRSLGGGLVTLPSFASQDPLTLVMANAEVPPNKRRCPHCDNKVNRLQGFCPHCGKEYTFEPSLAVGDVVGGKLEIKGPIAFGGLGWIYLAWDRDLARWAVLKGLLNAKDEAAAAAAVSERRFLAAVKHPKIVGIYDFVQHGSESFIVMEFVGGKTVESLRKDLDLVDVYQLGADTAKAQPLMTSVLRKDVNRRKSETVVQRRGLLPIAEACAYVLAILPAFTHLHERGIVYCDFKPDNFMVEGDDVKLIDLGGARLIDDPDGDIFGTIGFMAPEASENPIAVSDIYSIGRALACLTMDFAHQGVHEHSLPSPASQPILAKWESFQRLLLRATHPDPDERFQSAQELADQLHGVLREVAAEAGSVAPFDSAHFGPDNLIYPDDGSAMASPLARSLPSLRMDQADADVAATALAISDGSFESLLTSKSHPSTNSELLLVDALREASRFQELSAILDRLQARDPFNWKVQWERGKFYLAQGLASAAIDEFERVYFEMPGELAPKLGRAFALEAAGRHREASLLYTRIAQVDARMASAIFGLARCLSAMGDARGSFAAYGKIPEAHSLFAQSRLRAAKALVDARDATLSTLMQAAASVQPILGEGSSARQLAGVILLKAAMLVQSGVTPNSPADRIFGIAPSEHMLRLGAEREFLAAARMARNAEDKNHWVDMANRARPRTLF